MIVTVFTPTIRLDGAMETARSIQVARALTPEIEVRHVIAYWPGEPDWSRTRYADWLTVLIRDCPAGWIFGVDDDNRMHPLFLRTLARAVEERPDAWAFLFGMHYQQFRNGILKPRLPPMGGHCDGGQAALWRDHAVMEPWRHGGYGDGEYLHALYQRAPDRWVAVPDVVTSHNHQAWSGPYPPAEEL